MKCYNCGYPLVDGQIICSNCDTLNHIEKEINTNINFYNFNDSLNEDNHFQVEENIVKTKEINVKRIVLIIILILILIVFVYLFKYNKITYDIDNWINNSKGETIEDMYLNIYREIKSNNILNTNFSEKNVIVCENDCNKIYNYDDKKYYLNVIDKNKYYEIILYRKDNKKINVDCDNLNNATCSQKIVGKVYKEINDFE